MKRKGMVMDDLLLSFAKDNMITITLILSILKVVAVETPWATDDKIIKILTGFFGRKNDT